MQAHNVYFMKKYIICLHNPYMPFIKTKKFKNTFLAISEYLP